jgi:aspartate kinase
MIVMKFGGTSVGSASKILRAARIVKGRHRRNPVVVVSAMGGMTDRLEELGAKAASGESWEQLVGGIIADHETAIGKLNLETNLLSREVSFLRKTAGRVVSARQLSEANRARLLSFGERCSVKLLAASLHSIGVKSSAHNAFDLGMLTDRNYREAKILGETPGLLRSSIKKLEGVPVVTGFLGAAKSGEVTTLGRGGSDISASVIGAALGAKEIEIWTDVSGVMTADPRAVSGAWPVRKLSFHEAAELAYFGARVLHPKTIAPAIDKAIPVRVLNTFDPEDPGTLIVPKSRETGIVAKAIAYKKGITAVIVDSLRMLEAHGFLARVFRVFEKHSISVDMITTSEVSISLTIDDTKNLESAVKELREFSSVSVMRRRAIVCVVGEGMKRIRAMAGRIFSCLGREDINVEMISQGASEINISFLVHEREVKRAVRALHRDFFGK